MFKDELASYQASRVRHRPRRIGSEIVTEPTPSMLPSGRIILTSTRFGAIARQPGARDALPPTEFIQTVLNIQHCRGDRQSAVWDEGVNGRFATPGFNKEWNHIYRN
jgi:hypothetical protein